MAVPANSLAGGSMPPEVKRASQTDANQSPFACKRYASTASSRARRFPAAHTASTFERSHFCAVTFICGHHSLRALSSGEALPDSRHPAHAIDLFAADAEARDFRRSAARQRGWLAFTAGEAGGRPLED